MIKIPVMVRHKKPDNDPSPVPNWFDDPELIGPCPCGQPPRDDCLLVEGKTELKRWFHPECLKFLDYEMDDEELEEKEQWENWMRRMQEDDE